MKDLLNDLLKDFNKLKDIVGEKLAAVIVTGIIGIVFLGILVSFGSKNDTKTAVNTKKVTSEQIKKETGNQSKLNELSLTEKKKISDEIRSILKNGNAKISVDNKEYFNSDGGLFFSDYRGTSQEFTYYYSNSIAREGLIIKFYNDISFKRGDSNYGSFIYIKEPYSSMSVTPIEDNARIGWDKVIFGNENDMYVLFVKDKKIENPSRNTFVQTINLGKEAEKCYQVLLGKKPYIRFVKNDGSFVLAKIYGDFKDDSKMLDSMYDVIRLIPRINFLKNENGKAYLY